MAGLMTACEGVERKHNHKQQGQDTQTGEPAGLKACAQKNWLSILVKIFKTPMLFFGKAAWL